MKPVKTIEKLRSKTSVTIVALGDSLTYGWMVDTGYLDFLKEMMGKKFPENEFTLVNRGIPGDTAEGGLHRLERDVLELNPDCVFVQFALNDAFSGYSPEDFKGNVRMIIERIREKSDPDIVLITSVCLMDGYQDDLIGTYYDRLDELAREFRLPIAKVHEYWRSKISEDVTFGDLTLHDLAHPNSEGYRLMAEAIMGLFA